MFDITAQVRSNINQLSQEFDVITNNMANVSTTGYKRRINDFSKLLDSRLKIADAAAAKTEQTSPVAYDFSQGSLNDTGSQLDLALSGKGFFTIETPDGPVYTRNGMFHLDQDGKMVDSQGRIVSGESGQITIPPNAALSEVSISQDGTVKAGSSVVGKLKLADFGENENQLVAVGYNCFRMSDNKVMPEDPKNTLIRQGALEGSNVKIVEELVDMISVSRLYEANMKFMNAKKDAGQSLISVAMG